MTLLSATARAGSANSGKTKFHGASFAGRRFLFPSNMNALQFAAAAGFALLAVITFCLAFFRKPKPQRPPAPHPPGNSEIKYSAKENRFTVRGKRLIPVSAAVSLFFEPFDKERHAEEKSMKTGMAKEKIIEGWEMARERARATGIFLHDDIAAFFAGSQMKGCFRFTFKGKFSQTDETISLEKEEKLFMQFINAVPLRVYRTNYLVADSSLRLAGRVAFIGKCDGGYELYDWKRRSGISDENGNAITQNALGKKGTNGLENISDTPFWHYALQLNLYRAILEKNYHLRICAIYLIDVCPDKASFAKLQIPLLGKELQTALSLISNPSTVLPAN